MHDAKICVSQSFKKFGAKIRHGVTHPDLDLDTTQTFIFHDLGCECLLLVLTGGQLTR